MSHVLLGFANKIIRSTYEKVVVDKSLSFHFQTESFCKLICNIHDAQRSFFIDQRINFFSAKLHVIIIPKHNTAA